MQDGKVINIKEMLYTTCMKWRSIVVVAVAAAVLAGVFSVVGNMLKIKSDKYISDAMQKYESALAAYKNKGIEIERNIEENARRIAEQSDYIAKSMLMQIDPHNEWVGSIVLYVDAGYQIMPVSSIQNENPTWKICYSYEDFVNSGEFYQQVIDKLNISSLSEIKYLQELLSVSVNAERYAITVHVCGVTKEFCQNLLQISEEVFESHHAIIKSSIAEHTLTIMEPLVYSQINYELEEKQAVWHNTFNELNNTTSILKASLMEWEKEGKTIKSPILETEDAVIDAIKKFIIVGVVAMFGMVVIFCMMYALSGKVMGLDNLSRNTLVIAEIPKTLAKKNCIDNLINTIFGITLCSTEREDIVAAAAHNISQVYETLPVESRKSGEIALISDLKDDGIDGFVKELTDQEKSGLACTFIPAGNILLSAEAAKCSYKADAVVLVAKQGKSTISMMEKLMAQLRASNKTILGIVITEANAR